MEQDLLTIVIEESLDTEAIDHLNEKLTYFGSDVLIHNVAQKGPQASILLLGISSVAMIFGAAFIKKLADKSAEDAYPHIKNALSKLYEKYFGNNPAYKLTVYASGKNKSIDTKYSLLLGIYCVGKDNLQAKFIFETEWSRIQFEQATSTYIDAMVAFVSSENSVVRQLIIESKSKIQPHLIAWDFEKSELIRINPFPSHVRI